ncbi:hypothetical protein [Fibrella aquatilis]|uniref:YD repeat-containing protein n=1 Tax=Fibrella aquatilis TaxID=2817059 RepID=A0A939JYV8_9BACT|nr:hypothetical protein [Fibrella aquatilis]MBO0929545.1 hypothetical protein [Fibrella aquatilis]
MNLVKFSSNMLCMFFLFSFGHSSFAQQKNDWQKMRLGGRPKLIISSGLDSTVPDPDTSTLHFSPKGYLILQTSEYDGDNYRTEYKFAPSGLRSEVVVYKNGKLYLRRHVDSNSEQSENNLTEIITQDSNGEQKKIKNDHKGNRLLYETYSKLPDGSLKKTYGEYHSYKFDKYGNWYESKRLIKFQHIEELKNGGTTIRKITYY